MTIELVPQLEEKLSPIERLEALCDPGSLTLLRSDVRSRRMGEKARAGDGVIAGAGPRRRPPGVLLRAGPDLPRRLAGRAARRLDRPRAAARRPRRRAGRRLHRVRRRAHAGGARRARRLRAHLPRARRALGPDPADLRDLRRLGRRRLLLAGADRLRRDDRAGEHVPHRPGRRAGGHGRGRRRVRARRPEGARPQRRRALRRPHRLRRRAARARPARPPALRAPASRAPGLGRRRRRRATTPAPRCRTPTAQVYDVRDVVRGVVDGGRLLEWSAALGAQHRLRLRAPRRPPGRRRRQPAALPRRRARLRVGRQGARASCAPATRSASRCSCSSTRPASCPARSRSGAA